MPRASKPQPIVLAANASFLPLPRRPGVRGRTSRINAIGASSPRGGSAARNLEATPFRRNDHQSRSAAAVRSRVESVILVAISSQSFTQSSARRAR